MAATDPLPPDDERQSDALQRYHALQGELAAHQQRCPEIALRVELVTVEAYARALIALLDDVTAECDTLVAERDEAVLRAEQAERAQAVAESRLAARMSLDRDKMKILWDQRAEIAVLRAAFYDTGRDERRASFNARHAIADVVRRAVELEPAGDPSHLRGRCPWCSAAQLHVFTQYGRYLCASCRARGTAHDFVAQFPRQEGCA